MPGVFIPDLNARSDSGWSDTDNITAIRAPLFSGMARYAATVALFNGETQLGSAVPVVDGHWSFRVNPAAPLPAGQLSIFVRGINTNGRVGPKSKPLTVTIVTEAPSAPTVGLGLLSDSGPKGDGVTNVGAPTLAGFASRGSRVFVQIDGKVTQKVQANSLTGAWRFQTPLLANGWHEVTAWSENRAGLKSGVKTLRVKIEGPQTITVDLSLSTAPRVFRASDLVGPDTKGFIVTEVASGTLQKWNAQAKVWKNIPSKQITTSLATLGALPGIRNIGQQDLVRWIPGTGASGMRNAFKVIGWDDGRPLSLPSPSQVPGAVVNVAVAPTGVGQLTLTWQPPTSGATPTSYTVTLFNGSTTKTKATTKTYPATTATTMVFPGLAPQSNYLFTVWPNTMNGSGPTATVAFGLNTSIITFTRYDGANGHVYAIASDGSSERKITSNPGVQAHSNVSPDGLSIVYSQVNPDKASIESTTLDGGEPTVLNRGSDWSLVPHFSPDGARIAFTSDADGNYEIYTMAVDGSDVRQLTFTDSPTQHVGPKYSPNGSTLLYATDKDEVDPANQQDLWVIPVDGGVGTRITYGINDRESRSWSPDGKRIVTQTVENGVGQLLVLNADGSEMTRITNFPKDTPVFAPGGIFPQMSGAVTPAWSPDGEWIAFASNHEGSYSIYLIRPDGTQMTRLTHSGENDLSVGWGPLL